ncbi:MAG: hypothetical protein ACAI34_18600, partial [Verrucomicrobium sp.]
MSPPLPHQSRPDRKASGLQRCSLTPLFASLCWALTAATVLSQNPPQGEDITTGTKPEALQYGPTRSKVPGMIRWMWDPKQTVPRIEEAVWLKDGTRMYARSEKLQHLLQIWEPVAVDPAAPPKLNLIGTVPLRDTWAVSPDGQWIFGESRTDQTRTMAVYRAANWEGMWQAKSDVLGNLEQATFTRDGKHLILVTKLAKAVQVSAIDPASGRRVRQLQRLLPNLGEDEKASEIHVGAAQSTVLLPPFYRDDLTLSRWNPADGSQVPVSKPMKDNSNLKMTLSGDEQWLVLWNSAGYKSMKREGGLYGNRFGGVEEERCIQFVRVSPDASTLVVSGGQKFKVIRLADERVVKDSATECLCGLFAMDGRTYWNTCRPLTPISTKTWARGDDSQAPPKRAMEQVEFSPDGRFLATLHARQIDVWPLEGMALTPAAVLTGPRDNSLSTFAWDRTANRVIGGDYCAVLQWNLPQSLGATTNRTPVEATKLFETSATDDERLRNGPAFAHTQQLTVSPATGDCLISLNSHHTNTVIRNPDRPTIAKTIKVGHEA